MNSHCSVGLLVAMASEKKLMVFVFNQKCTSVDMSAILK